MYKTSSINKS